MEVPPTKYIMIKVHNNNNDDDDEYDEQFSISRLENIYSNLWVLITKDSQFTEHDTVLLLHQNVFFGSQAAHPVVHCHVIRVHNRINKNTVTELVTRMITKDNNTACLLLSISNNEPFK